VAGEGDDAKLGQIKLAQIKRYLPWTVAMVLFMEQLDATVVHTAVPTIAASLQVSALALKDISTAYLLSLALGLPLSGWMADRFGTRPVFAFAVLLFTVASVLCGVAVNAPMLLSARVLQGAAAAMMTPLGRLMIVRTFEKHELLVAMNFVIVPALMGALLGPLVGGLIVHWTSWRAIFFINVPVGLLALWLVARHVPNYRAPTRRPLDWMG
jgi:MFS family permease